MKNPFDLSIENLYKDQATAVLYIVSEERENDPSQHIRFRMVNTSGKIIHLVSRPVSRIPHFELQFRQSTLFAKKIAKNQAGNDRAKEEIIAHKFRDALEAAFPGSSWGVEFKLDPSKSIETVSIYYLTDNKNITLHNNDEIKFTVKGLSAEASIGTRSSNVHFIFNRILKENSDHHSGKIPDNEEYLCCDSIKHIDIINHDGKTFAPLDFLVLGSATLVHRSQNNDVRLQMIETGGRKIRVTKHTFITIMFPYYAGSYDPNYHPAWVFGEKNTVNEIEAKQDSRETTVLKPHNSKEILYKASNWGYRSLSFNFVKDQEIDQLVLLFKHVPADGPIGEARIKISIHNLPGYWDTDFEVKLDKTLLSTQYYESGNKIARNYGMLNGQIVIGENLHEKAEWNKETSFNSTVNITSPVIVDNSVNGLKKVDRLLRLHDGAEGMNGLDISVGNGLNTPSSLKDHFLIKADQYNLGTMFKVDPLGNIENMGDVITAGSIINQGSIKSTGNVESQGEIRSTGNIESQGRIKDKAGFIMPVGSIIAYGGRNAPEGWLLCDGRAITGEAIHAELRAIIGDTTPDLRSRFIVGAGQGNDLSLYGLNTTGGQEKHKLTEEEMPSHVHSGKTNDDGAHEHTNLRWRWCDYDKDDIPVLSRDSHNPETDSKKGTVGSDGSAHQHEFTTNSTGANQAHNNMPPYYALTYIIKY